ncbi:histone H3-like centromeric protein A [Phymastichus coffea]|uniref:histone H3-like centromeric protein A n=1 Tax=Phymastichus coffea TaxID=108790 RepID=UPI00273B2CB0|nr:histone H3-like centromeric protein A [Phymastichus coffea]
MVRHKTKGKKIKTSKQKSETKVMNKTTAMVKKNHILQEITSLQKTTHLLIPKLPFARLLKEILNDLFPRNNSFKLQLTALEALQEAAEMYLVQFFEDAYLLCLHNKRVTLMQKDMILLRRIRGRNDIINR